MANLKTLKKVLYFSLINKYRVAYNDASSLTFLDFLTFFRYFVIFRSFFRFFVLFCHFSDFFYIFWRFVIFLDILWHFFIPHAPILYILYILHIVYFTYFNLFMETTIWGIEFYLLFSFCSSYIFLHITTQDFCSNLSDDSDDCNQDIDGDYDGYDCDNDLNDWTILRFDPVYCRKIRPSVLL